MSETPTIDEVVEAAFMMVAFVDVHEVVAEPPSEDERLLLEDAP